MVTLAALPRIQIVRKIVLAFAVVSFLLLFALTSSAREAGPTLDAFRWIGIVAIVVCILGRTWCTLYIDGRKIEQLVTVGPYSVCRNPLYSFNILGVAGMAAQHGSLLLVAAFCTFTWLVFLVVAMLEESFLANMHGDMFADYVRSTPRFLPNPRLWRDVFTVTVRPPKILRTFGDGLCFLIPVPLDAVFERLQSAGLLPVLLRLF